MGFIIKLYLTLYYPAGLGIEYKQSVSNTTLSKVAHTLYYQRDNVSVPKPGYPPLLSRNSKKKARQNQMLCA